jgi:hypothetical protein
VPHPLDPLRGCGGRAGLRFGFADPARSSIGVEEETIGGSFRFLEILLAHRSDFDGGWERVIAADGLGAHLNSFMCVFFALPSAASS